MMLQIVIAAFVLAIVFFAFLWFYGKSLYYEEGLRRLESVKDIATNSDKILFWHYWDNGGGEFEPLKMTPLRMAYRRIFRRYEGA